MNELIQTIDCLTPDELGLVLSWINTEAQWEPTTVFGLGGETNSKSSVRTGTRCNMNDSHPITEMMHQAFNRALLDYALEMVNVSPMYLNQYPTPGAYATSSYREGVQLLKYEEGQYYNNHYDMAPWKDTHEYNRTFSIVLYLNEEFEGGRTIFPNKAYKPKAGQALIFPSNWCFPHRCEPVSSGTKLAAVTWYYAVYKG